MSDYPGPYQNPSQPTPLQPRRMSVVETWTSALVPSEANYDRIVQDQGAGLGKALLFVILASIIGAILGYLVGLAVQAGLGAAGGASVEDLGVMALVQTFGSGIGLVCAIPLAFVGFLFGVGIIHASAGMMGGKGDFGRLAYGLAAPAVPLSLITGIVAPIPYVNCLLVFVGIYQAVLGIFATRAAHRFGWGQAIMAYFVVPLLLVVLVGCGVIVLLALLGPAIGSVFSNIVNNI